MGRPGRGTYLKREKAKQSGNSIKEINMARGIKSDLFLEAEKMLHATRSHKELSETFVAAIDKVDKLYGNWGFKAYEELSNRQIVEVVLISCEITIPGFRAIKEE